MKVLVDAGTGTASVEGVDDLTSLSVVVMGGTVHDITTVGTLGTLDGDHAWLDVDSLRRAAHDAPPDRWLDRYEAMIAWAMSKGWTSDDGRAVRAHVESLPEAVSGRPA